ncbi:hypothetical protein J6590_072552 [Homalodisca vitripennis]|nr:hypothetical protein J6590_072552 [Homalodisca vitripennis]
MLLGSIARNIGRMGSYCSHFSPRLATVTHTFHCSPRLATAARISLLSYLRLLALLSSAGYGYSHPPLLTSVGYSRSHFSSRLTKTARTSLLGRLLALLASAGYGYSHFPLPTSAGYRHSHFSSWLTKAARTSLLGWLRLLTPSTAHLGWLLPLAFLFSLTKVLPLLSSAGYGYSHLPLLTSAHYSRLHFSSRLTKAARTSLAGCLLSFALLSSAGNFQCSSRLATGTRISHLG